LLSAFHFTRCCNRWQAGWRSRQRQLDFAGGFYYGPPRRPSPDPVQPPRRFIAGLLRHRRIRCVSLHKIFYAHFPEEYRGFANAVSPALCSLGWHPIRRRLDGEIRVAPSSYSFGLKSLLYWAPQMDAEETAHLPNHASSQPSI